MNKWKLTKDVFDFYTGISSGKQTILHLNTGTKFNQQNAKKFVDLLNKNKIKWKKGESK